MSPIPGRTSGWIYRGFRCPTPDMAFDDRVPAVLQAGSHSHDFVRGRRCNEIRSQPRRAACPDREFEVDLLDLDSPRQMPAFSSSTGHGLSPILRIDAYADRVIVVAHNVIANVTQSMYGYFDDPPPTGTVVAWLPAVSDIGLILGIYLRR